MSHGIAHRKFTRDTTARKALLRGLCMNLIEFGTIKTTVAKAKSLRPIIEPIITRARENTLQARREIAKTITNPILLKKLFDEVAPKFVGTPGGYTRVVKAGHRVGDAADVAYIQLTK